MCRRCRRKEKVALQLQWRRKPGQVRGEQASHGRVTWQSIALRMPQIDPPKAVSYLCPRYIPSTYLGVVFARESTTAVTTPAAVRVNNNLSTGKTSVSLRTTNDESSAGLDMINGIVINVF